MLVTQVEGNEVANENATAALQSPANLPRQSDGSCDKKRKSSAKKGAALQGQPLPKPATRALHLWGGDNVRVWLATEHVGLTVLEGQTFNGGLLRNGQALIAQLTAAQVSAHDCDMFLACRSRLILAKLS